MDHLPRTVVTFVLAAALFTGPAAATDLQTVLERFDAVQNSIRTLSAEFTQTETNPLLIDPITAEGRFYLTKPNAIRWEYSIPEEMRFVIADDQYTGYYPAQKRAEQRNVQRWSDHIFRFFGVGQGSAELSKTYDIALDQEQNTIADTYLLVMEPKRKRVRKRVVEEARFWLDASTFLPLKVEYRSRAGNTRVIQFKDIRLNPDLSATLFHVDLPADVEVSNGFSGMPDFSPDATR